MAVAAEAFRIVRREMLIGFAPIGLVVLRCKPIRTERLEVICDLARCRLLQRSIAAAISAFEQYKSHAAKVRKQPHAKEQGGWLPQAQVTTQDEAEAKVPLQETGLNI